MRFPRTLSHALALAGALCATAAAQDRNGPEFQVNTYTSGDQHESQAAMDRHGRFLVVWKGEGAGETSGVFARRYGSSGLPASGEFQVNDPTPVVAEYLPTVGVTAEGDFIVAWSSEEGDGSFSTVRARRYAPTGAPLAAEFQVNTFTTDDQFAPSVAVHKDGSFAVAWKDFQSDSYSYGVRARRFDASGTPIGDDIVVNDAATVVYPFPQVRPGAGGSFVVVWLGTTDGTDYDVLGRSYDAGGSPIGGEFVINTATIDSQYTFPSLASDSSGRFVVTWEAYDVTTGSSEIKGRRLAASGPVGAEFTVNAYTSNGQYLPWVAMDPAGNFVVTWHEDLEFSSDVEARRFDASGNAVGNDFRVNTYTPGFQGYPSVTARRPGEFVVVWQSDGQDGDYYGVHGQRFGDLIFADGFR